MRVLRPYITQLSPTSRALIQLARPPFPCRVALPILTFRSNQISSRNVKMAVAENYDDVLKGKYPAKEHARKVAKWIIEKGGDKNGTIYLEAQKQKLNEVCLLEQ